MRPATLGIVCALAGTALLPASASGQDAPARATLTPENAPNGEITVDFGEDRGEKTINVLLGSTAPLDTPPSATVLNTLKSDGELFDGRVTATAELVGDSQVKVPVVIDPDDTDLGNYTTSILLTGKNVEKTTVKVLAKLDRSPAKAGAVILAIVALIIGLSGGGVLRYFSERGSKLRELLQDYELLEGALPAANLRPPALVRDLNYIRLNLANYRAAAAEELLKSVKEKSVATFAALDRLSMLEARLVGQEAAIAAIPHAGATRADLLAVVALERLHLQGIVARTYPDAAPVAEDINGLDANIGKFDFYLGEYASTGNPDDLAWGQAVDLFKNWKFDEGVQKIPRPAGATATAPTDVAPEQGITSPLGSDAGLLARTKWSLIRHGALIVGLLFGVGFVILGLETVFDINTMFLNNDFKDFLALVAWGFAAALVGTTTTDLASKVKPKDG